MILPRFINPRRMHQGVTVLCLCSHSTLAIVDRLSLNEVYQQALDDTILVSDLQISLKRLCSRDIPVFAYLNTSLDDQRQALSTKRIPADRSRVDSHI